MFIIKYSKQAVRFLKKQDTVTKKRILLAIKTLPKGDIKKLKGEENKFRLRVGSYRIIFDRMGNLLYIEKIGSRGEIYK